MPSIGKKSKKHAIGWFWFTVVFILQACSLLPGGVVPTALPPTSSVNIPLATPTSAPTLAPTATDEETVTLPTPSATPEAPTALPTPEALPAQALPDPAGFTWTPVIEGLNRPIGLANAGDGSGRLFIIEQIGVIRLWKDGRVNEQPFLDIRDRIEISSSEQGLLGLAFHPRYTETGYFFVNYTDQNGDTVIARFSVTTEDPDRADPASELRLLFIPQPFPNHNGGEVTFGPDGMLYLGLGDGGAANDPDRNGQSTSTLLGKILRIDVNEGERYAIPQDNPFIQGGGLPEIWAYGLRNPWRFSFDPLNGDLYIADVGQNAWEEIDYLPAGSPAGANFGWDFREGAHEFEGKPAEGLSLIDPVAEYSHSQGCSVTGGMVYRGSALPEWNGVYVYGDYCSGLVWGLLKDPNGAWQGGQLFDTDARITSFGVDEAGELYLVSHQGSVYRLSRAP